MICRNINPKKTIRLWLLFALLILVTSCAHNNDWAKRIAWSEYDFNNLPGKETYPDAGAVILLDEGKMETYGDNETGFSVFERHRITKVLDNRGRRFASMAVPYSTGSTIENLKARTISPDGSITIVSKDNIYDVNLYPDFIFYSDQRAKIFTFPKVQEGAVLEYRYQVRLANRSLWHSWTFQSDVPTIVSRFTLVEPSEWEIHYKEYQTNVEPIITEAPNGFKSKYFWELRDVPPLRHEFGMPPSRQVTAQVAVAPLGFEKWEDVSKWYYDLSEPQMKAGEEVKSLASRITRKSESDSEKLRHIFKWMQDRVRYIAVEIGIGGYKPHAAEAVSSNQYGDCKDMTTLVCALAREVGIEAYQTLVSTRQNGIPDTSLSSPFHFNHVIAYFPAIGDSGIWIDATDKSCNFGQLPWYDQGLPVLVVGKDGEPNLVTTPREPYEENRSDVKWEVELQKTGAAEITGETRLFGALAQDLRRQLHYASQDEKRRWLETSLAQQCSGAKLKSFQIEGLNPVADPVIVTISFHTATFTLPHNQKMIIRPGAILSLDLPDYFRADKRTYPIQFRYGFISNFDLQINLPPAWQPDAALVEDSLSSTFGSASWQQTYSDNTFRAIMNYRLTGHEISPEQYPDFQQFLDSVRANDLQETIFINKQEKLTQTGK